MGNLLTFLMLGLAPENHFGNELLAARVGTAKRLVDVTIQHCDAAAIQYRSGFELIIQSTVFYSILSEELRRAVANNMWSHLSPGGAILSTILLMAIPGTRMSRV